MPSTHIPDLGNANGGKTDKTEVDGKLPNQGNFPFLIFSKKGGDRKTKQLNRVFLTDS